MGIMKREVQHTTHGGAPGKPAWRAEIERGIRHIETKQMGSGIEMMFGYEPSGLPATVRAMIVHDGSGSAAGGAPITAGPEGRSVWDDDVSGKHPSRAKSEYPLPAAFNQAGNHFAENALTMMETRFGETVESTMQAVPDSAYYGNVSSSGG